jgi:hypothetical protein
MRWYKDALAHGQTSFLVPDIQLPAGGHIGNWSPMHFQALLYLPLSCIADDLVAYNIIWLFNIVFTGVTTFVLIRQLLPGRGCAFFGGLVGMLSGPMMLHGLGHLELITLGWFPLFLAAWLRWVDEPGWRRLAAASGCYLMVALSAGYFAVFAMVPATLYVLHAAVRGGLAQTPVWVRKRLGWFALFVAVTLPCFLLAFAAQLDSRAHGYSVARSRGEFMHYGAPVWTYVVPSSYHSFWQWLPVKPFRAARIGEVEQCSYLGIVTLALIGCALLARAPLRRRWFWWGMFASLVVLSFGSRFSLWGLSFNLPGQWLYDWCPPFRQLRVPARFNLHAAIAGAVLAAAGMTWLLSQIRQPAARVALLTVLSTLALLDLSVRPNHDNYRVLPEPPACYEFLRREARSATFLEVPHFGSGTANDLHSCFTYWQSIHHLRTGAGYSGFSNAHYEGPVTLPTPFHYLWLRQPDAWAEMGLTTVDVVKDVELADYSWLFLTSNHYDYLVVHDDSQAASPFQTSRIKERLGPGLVFADARASVFAVNKLPEPRRPTLLCTTGWPRRAPFWRKHHESHILRVAEARTDARLAVYNPDPTHPLRFTLEAVAVAKPRTVRVLANQVEVARWMVSGDEALSYTTPPFYLPAGRSELTLESDGESPPARGEEIGYDDRNPASLWVTGVRLAGEATASPTE